MFASKLLRRLRFCIPLAALGLLVFSGTSRGQATVGTFGHQDLISGTETGIVGCFPDLSGTITGTETVEGRFVSTDQGFHFHGKATQDYRIDFENGYYLISSSPDRFDFNSNPGAALTVYTETQEDLATLYTPDGQPAGSVNTFSVTHYAWTDINGNGQPDAGEITGSVSDFRQICP